MNANEIYPKAGVRLNRIKTISRTLKIMFLLYFLCFGFFLPFVRKGAPDGYWTVFGGTYAMFADIPLMVKLLALLGIGIFLAIIVTGYQLLSLYEKGIIFSARNVRMLGRIGCLALGYGLLKVWGPALFLAWYQWIGSTGLMLNSFLWVVYGLFGSPWIIGGLFLIVISRIMDEGRKIQEEQELTV